MEIKNLLTGLNPYDKRSQVDKAEGQQVKTKRGNEAAGSPQGDRVEFSDEAKLRTEAFKAASSAPDVRRDKVEEIKARIAAGTYEMDSQKIASNLIRDELDLNS